MATLVDVLRLLGARPAERRAGAPLVLDGAVLGLESLFGGPLAGDVAVHSQSSESIVFEAPLELAACGTLWMPDVDDADTFREAVADAHATLGARLETDLRTLAQLGYDAMLDAPRPRAIAQYAHAGHELTVAIGADGELTLVRVDDTEVSDAQGRALAAPEEVDGATARAAVERVLARLVDSGAVFAADSLDVDMASHSDEHEGDERRPTSVNARPPAGTVPLSEEELGELNAALDDEDDGGAADDDDDDDEDGRAAQVRTQALSAVSQIDVDIADDDDLPLGGEDEEPEPTQAVEAPVRRRSAEATRAEEEPSVDARIEARMRAQPAPPSANAASAVSPTVGAPEASVQDDDGSLADAFDDDDDVGVPTRVPGVARVQAPAVDVDSMDDEPEPTVTALAQVTSPRQSVAEKPRAAEPMESSLLDAFDDEEPALDAEPSDARASDAEDDEGPRTDSLARPTAADESRTAAMPLGMLSPAGRHDGPSGPPTLPGEVQSPMAAGARDGAGAIGTADDDALASHPDGPSGAAEVSDEPDGFQEPGEPSTDAARARAPSPSVAVTREVSGFGDIVVDDGFDDGFDGGSDAGDAEGFDDSSDRTRTTTTYDDADADEAGADEGRGRDAGAALPVAADTAAWVAPPIAASAPASATMGDDEAGSATSMAPPRAPPGSAVAPSTATHAVAAIAARSLLDDDDDDSEQAADLKARGARSAAHERDGRSDERDLARDAAGFDDGDDFEEETVAARPDDQKTRAVFVQDALRELSTRAALGAVAAPPVTRATEVSGAPAQAAADAAAPETAGVDGEDPGALEARAEELEAEARALRDRAVVIRASRLPQSAGTQEPVAATAPPAQPSVESSALPSLASVDVESVDEDTFAIGTPRPAAPTPDKPPDKHGERQADRPQAKTPPPASDVPALRPGARLNPEDLFEGVSFAEVQAALREQEARNAQTQLAAPEIGELHEVSDSGDVFGNMDAGEPSVPQPPVSVEAPRAVGLVVEDARARDRLKKRLQVRIADLVEAKDVHDVSALPTLRELAAVVFVRPRTDERTLAGLERLASLEERPRILVLSSDASFDRVAAIDLRVALGERASEVAQQVLDGLLQLGVPLSEATEP